jgi:hypothetical protein
MQLALGTWQLTVVSWPAPHMLSQKLSKRPAPHVPPPPVDDDAAGAEVADEAPPPVLLDVAADDGGD